MAGVFPGAPAQSGSGYMPGAPAGFIMNPYVTMPNITAAPVGPVVPVELTGNAARTGSDLIDQSMGRTSGGGQWTLGGDWVPGYAGEPEPGTGPQPEYYAKQGAGEGMELDPGYTGPTWINAANPNRDHLGRPIPGYANISDWADAMGDVVGLAASVTPTGIARQVVGQLGSTAMDGLGGAFDVIRGLLGLKSTPTTTSDSWSTGWSRPPEAVEQDALTTGSLSLQDYGSLIGSLPPSAVQNWSNALANAAYAEQNPSVSPWEIEGYQPAAAPANGDQAPQSFYNFDTGARQPELFEYFAPEEPVAEEQPWAYDDKTDVYYRE